MNKRKYSEYTEIVTSELYTALNAVDPDAVEKLVEYILNAEKVFFIGVGRVFLSLEAIAKRFAHCGIKTVCVGEITEPAMTKNDLLIVASGSGESLVPVAISKKAKDLGATVIQIGSNPDSTIGTISDFFVRIPVRTKLALPDEIDSKQPMTSLFEQSLLLLGDILALKIIEEKSLDLKGLWKFHANLE